MVRFLAGVVLGLVMGVSATAIAVVIVGNDGYAMGWSVTKDGEEICSNPHVSTGAREIECD